MRICLCLPHMSASFQVCLNVLLCLSAIGKRPKIPPVLTCSSFYIETPGQGALLSHSSALFLCAQSSNRLKIKVSKCLECMPRVPLISNYIMITCTTKSCKHKDVMESGVHSHSSKDTCNCISVAHLSS